MAKKAYLTDVNGIHRKVRKKYLTDESNVFRKVRKAYMSVGGVWRPCFSGGELTYYGKITNLSVSRYGLAATTVGGKALFAGGFASSTSNYKTVDSYDKALTRTTATM